MVNLKNLARKLKAADVEEDGAIALVVGSPTVEFDELGENPSGKILVPVELGGQRYIFRCGTESQDVIAAKLTHETADWVHGELVLGTKTERIGGQSVSWVIAKDARSTKRRDERLAGLQTDERNSRLMPPDA